MRFSKLCSITLGLYMESRVVAWATRALYSRRWSVRATALPYRVTDSLHFHIVDINMYNIIYASVVAAVSCSTVPVTVRSQRALAAPRARRRVSNRPC